MIGKVTVTSGPLPTPFTFDPTLGEERDGVIRSARISACERYRYALGRSWANDMPDAPALVWIMLNPSTADGKEDDHTIRKICQFSRNMGYGSALVVNLFAWRATKPADLTNCRKGGEDIIGPDNDAHIIDAATRSPLIIAGWGNGVPHPWFVDRVRAVSKLLANKAVMCLGLTGEKQPRHPLYLPYDTPLSPWSVSYR